MQHHKSQTTVDDSFLSIGLKKLPSKLTPRIERFTMALQDVDFEIKREQGRDELDPLEYLS